MEQSGFVHFCYPSPRSGWVIRLLGRLQSSQSQVLRERAADWRGTKLAELGGAVNSKLEIVGKTIGRVESVVSRIGNELAERRSEVMELINKDACFRFRQDGILFEALLDIEAFLFEMSSALDITEAFIKIFRKVILDDSAGRREKLIDCLNRLAIDDHWFRNLNEARNLFTHETAPWLALEVQSVDPPRFDFILLKRDVVIPISEDYFHFDQCRQIYRGYMDAMDTLHGWLMIEIANVEREQPA